MTEQAFSQKIRRENAWRWTTAVIATGLCVLLTYGHLCIAVDHGLLDNGARPYLFFVQALIIVLAAGVSWAMRDAQRQDLYVEVRRNSITQLRRFRGELDDEIHRLEAERSEGAKNGRRRKRTPIKEYATEVEP
jgi:hypothetical protein